MSIDAKRVARLREQTGAGMMDCKRALTETNGDFEKAIEHLRKKGVQAAAKRASKVAAEGLVHSYIHTGGKIGVLLEVNCETDFVARTTDFTQLVHDIAMHIAATAPAYVGRDEVPQDILAKEREILAAQIEKEGKPAAVMDKIIEGRIGKFYKDVCLLEQPFVKDANKSIEQLLNECSAKIGERLVVRRFMRFVLGEGIERAEEDFAKEVEKVASST